MVPTSMQLDQNSSRNQSRTRIDDSLTEISKRSEKEWQGGAGGYWNFSCADAGGTKLNASSSIIASALILRCVSTSLIPLDTRPRADSIFHSSWHEARTRVLVFKSIQSPISAFCIDFGLLSGNRL